MKAIMDEDKVIKLLDSQIRNSYGNVFWTHKIHEKDADIYRCWNNWIKIAPHEPLSSAHMWIYFAQNFSQHLKLRIVFHEIVHLICPNEKTGKKSRFLLELNEMPNEDNLLLIGFPRRFFDFFA